MLMGAHGAGTLLGMGVAAAIGARCASPNSAPCCC
jgi:hypothetical protein